VPAYWRSNLGAIAQRDLPKVLANAINRTTEEAQARGRQRMHQVLTIRTSASAQFMERLLKFRPDERARVDRLRAWLRVEGPATKSRRGIGNGRTEDLLLRHEGGGSSRTGPLFIPADSLRPSPTTVVPRALYPVALGLAPRRGIDGSTTAARRQGKRGAFMMPGLGIFQRTGPDDVEKLWHFTEKVRTPARLRLNDTIRRTVAERMGLNVQGMATTLLRRRIMRAGYQARRMAA